MYLTTILIMLVIIVYIQYYINYKPDFKINQIYLDQFKINLLYEKYPIIVYDKLIEPKDLLKTFFAYSYNISQDFPILFDNKVTINLSKYQIIYNQLADVDINLIHPKYRSQIEFSTNTNLNNTNKILLSKEPLSKLNVEYVTVKLKKNKIFILPTYWIYNSNLPVQTIMLDDYMSYIVSKIYKFMLAK